jgi:hypothetical protein
VQKRSLRRTYRTWQVLGAISDLTSVRPGPGPSNRELAEAAGIEDEGQASRLLKRLERLCLIENTGVGQSKGGANAWGLTAHGREALWELEGRFGSSRD